MSRLKRDEETAMQYLVSMLAVKKYKLKLVILNRYHINDKYVSEFSFVCKDSVGRMHNEPGIKLFGADYVFMLMSLQKRFPCAVMYDATADKDNPLKNCVKTTAIKVDKNDVERSENDIQANTET